MALEFDGATQYIQVAQTKDLPIYNETTYSVCGWVKASAQDDKRIFAEGSSASNNPLLTIGSGRTTDSTTNKLQVFIRNDANSFLLGDYGTKSTTTVFDDTWHHFCWNDNNGTAELYVDSVKDATNFNYTRSGTLTMNRTGIAAVIRAAVSNWLDGELFDIRCYNRCLTPNEIAEIYHKRGADRILEGLVGWWRMDEMPSGYAQECIIDGMNSTTGWSGGTITANNTIYTEGACAISIQKTNTAVSFCSLKKDISAIDLTGKDIYVDLYIKDSTTYNKLQSSTAAGIKLSTVPGVDYYVYYVPRSSLSYGAWNTFGDNINNFSVGGSPSINNITRIEVMFFTNNTTDTTSQNDIICDCMRTYYDLSTSGRIIDLSGNANHGTLYGLSVYQDSPHRLRRGFKIL